MLLDIIKQRYSARTFTDCGIEEDKLEIILEAGRLSPSGGNEQPWLFGVVRDKDQIKQLAEASYKQSWIADAPLLIVLCTVNVEDSRGAREIQKRRFPQLCNEIDGMDKMLYSFLNSEEHQTKIAGTQMALQALEFGIQTTWVSCFQVDRVSKILNLPKLTIPSEILVFGYPAGDPILRTKKDLKDIVFYDVYKR